MSKRESSQTSSSISPRISLYKSFKILVTISQSFNRFLVNWRSFTIAGLLDTQSSLIKFKSDSKSASDELKDSALRIIVPKHHTSRI